MNTQTSKPIKAEWEVLTQSYGEKTDRLKVPGGWLYRTRVEYATQAKHFSDTGLALNTIFVADHLC